MRGIQAVRERLWEMKRSGGAAAWGERLYRRPGGSHVGVGVSWLPIESSPRSGEWTTYRYRPGGDLERDPPGEACALAWRHLATAGRGRALSVSPARAGKGSFEEGGQTASRRARAQGTRRGCPGTRRRLLHRQGCARPYGSLPFVGAQVFSTTVGNFLRGNRRLANLLRMRLHKLL